LSLSLSVPAAPSFLSSSAALMRPTCPQTLLRLLWSLAVLTAAVVSSISSVKAGGVCCHYTNGQLARMQSVLASIPGSMYTLPTTPWYMSTAVFQSLSIPAYFAAPLLTVGMSRPDLHWCSQSACPPSLLSDGYSFPRCTSSPEVPSQRVLHRPRAPRDAVQLDVVRQHFPVHLHLRRACHHWDLHRLPRHQLAFNPVLSLLNSPWTNVGYYLDPTNPSAGQYYIATPSHVFSAGASARPAWAASCRTAHDLVVATRLCTASLRGLLSTSPSGRSLVSSWCRRRRNAPFRTLESRKGV
jgi:hypothetical protein